MRRATAIIVAAVLAATLAPSAASAQLSGWNQLLTRLPYLTDATQTSIEVTWADMNRNARGIVTYGQAPTCNGSSASAATLGAGVTVGSVKEYPHTVIVTGLQPGTTYCYRIHDHAPTTDLLGSMASPTFQTLPSSASSFTFLVLGDWGSTASGFNVGQADLDAALAQAAQSSNALFVADTGDVAYPSGSQTNYGDLNQTGINVSNVFGPAYWPQVGLSTPTMGTTANHGRSSTFFNIWPEARTVAASNGTYGMINYPAVDGVPASTAPGDWYAWSVGNVRFYSLGSDWGDTSTGTASGSLCGQQFPGYSCPTYQIDADQHWTPGAPEYQWLTADLASHPAAMKFAFFHFPLRSDVPQQPNDPYTNVSPLNPHTPSLESLLAQNGVAIAFNGHAHIYQRNIAPPGGIISYVSGGGGGVLEPIAKSGIKNCSSTDAYGLGWSPGSAKGSLCGSAIRPTSANQVFHFLKVHVSGTDVTVTPINANGDPFDSQTYSFGGGAPAAVRAGSTAAAGIRQVTGVRAHGSVALKWSAPVDARLEGFDIYRAAPGGRPSYVASVPRDAHSFRARVGRRPGIYRFWIRARNVDGAVSARTLVNSIRVE